MKFRLRKRILKRNLNLIDRSVMLLFRGVFDNYYIFNYPVLNNNCYYIRLRRWLIPISFFNNLYRINIRLAWVNSKDSRWETKC